MQQSEPLLPGLVDGNKKLMEEIRDPEWELELEVK